MRILITYIVLSIAILFTWNSQAQTTVQFDYTVSKTAENQYEFLMNLPNPSGVQHMEIGFLDFPEDEFASETFIASINKKSDNNFYFFINNNEVKINPAEFVFLVERLQDISDSEIKRVYIKLMDKDLNILNTYQQVLTNY